MDLTAPASPHSVSAQPSQGASWQLVLLGRVEVYNATTRIHRWPSRATTALLARVALEPRRVHPREELIEVLWPGVAANTGRARLRQALSSLRALLRAMDGAETEVLLSNRQAISLNTRALDCDATQFQQDAQAGRHDRARALYAGELMPGFYDDWIVEERRRLAAIFERLPVAGHPGAAPSAQPGPSTLEPAHPTNTLALPSYWTRAFGQDALVAELVAMVRRHRWTTVLGPGGNGKTRLAVAASRALASDADRAFERLVYVPLVEQRRVGEVRDALHHALGIEGAGGSQRRLWAELGRQSTVLVLDNAEQVDSDVSDELAELLRACPSLHLLVTSRRRLGMPGEQVFAMPGLGVPGAGEEQTGRIEDVAEHAAVALFVDRARESRPEFHLTPLNVRSVVGMVRLLGGMPLAIELAATRVRVMHPNELLKRLRQGAGTPMLDLLARPALRANARSRHASMRHVVAWSWAQMRDEVKDLLKAMSVFVAPATAGAVAQAVAGLHEADAERAHRPSGEELDIEGEDNVQALLGEALEASLIVAQPESLTPVQRSQARTTYALLPPVREFAAEQCGTHAQQNVRRRLRRWLVALVQANPLEHRTWLQAELEHVWNLMLWAVQDGDPRALLALGVGLKGEWNRVRSMQELMSVLESALVQVASDAQDHLVSQTHYVLAVLCQYRNQCAPALQHADRALSSAPDDQARSMALSVRCWVQVQQGAEVARLQPDLLASETLAQRCGDARSQALAMGLRAMVEIRYFERFEDAEALLTQCIHMFDAQADRGQALFRRIELATCWARMGRAPQALRLLDDALAQCRSGSPTMILVYALTAVVRVHWQLRDGEAASRAAEEAVQAALENDWPLLLLRAQLHLVGAWVLCDRTEPAAIVLGHLCVRWPHSLGGISPADARQMTCYRRALRRRLGQVALRDMLAEGGLATVEEVNLLLSDAKAPSQAT